MESDIKACGAKTRSGTVCKSTELLRGGRCRLHGGLSTGPKTLEGKRRSALNTGSTYEELLENRSEESIMVIIARARSRPSSDPADGVETRQEAVEGEQPMEPAPA
jgi:hypothetical protein